MSGIAPFRPPVLSATAAPQTGAAAVAATATDGATTAAILQLGAGVVVTGTVVERTARGQLVLRTDKGALTIQTPLAIRLGAVVTLQLQSLGAQVQATILSVDGEPLAAASPAPATGEAGKAGAVPAAVPRDATSPAAGRPATTAPHVAAPAPAPAAALKPGIVVTGVLIPNPAPSAARNLAPAATSHAAAAVGRVVAPTAGPAAQPAAFRILGIAAPSPPAPAAPHAPTAAAPVESAAVPRIAPGLAMRIDAVTLAAVVTAGGPAEPGVLALRTALGVLKLTTPAVEPPGTTLLLEVLPADGDAARPPPAAADAARALPPRALALAQDWPALREAVAALQAGDPAAAQQVLNAAVPRVGPGLAAGLLFFIAAMRHGDVKSWIGASATDSLERAGQGATLARLADDVAVLPRLADSQPNGWQTMILPLFDGERLQQIRMHMRRARKDRDGPRDGVRFILEAELSRLGPLQLDGLVRMPAFDLVVRSREPLAPSLRADILQIFGDALAAAGLKGGVTFTAAPDIRPGPFEDRPDAGFGVTV